MDGSQWEQTCHNTLFGMALSTLSCDTCQRHNRLMLEQIHGCQLNARLLGATHNLDAKNGIPTDLKEIVMDAHLLKPQDL